MRHVPTALMICGLSLAIAGELRAQSTPAAPRATPAPAPAPAAPAVDPKQTMYALGVLLGSPLESFTLTPAELEQVLTGLRDGVLKKSVLPNPEAYGPRIQDLQNTRMAAAAAKQKELGKAFVAKAAAAPGATRTASGIVITPLKAGSGAAPRESDEVTVHYEGKLVDGTVFDSSLRRGEPATFPLDGVIPCWTEGVQQIKVGGKSRLVCPPETAYGERGAPPRIPGGSTLVFEVEVLETAKAPATPEAAPNKP
ncbi:MAG: FKBP-type peptidyl-prolyl cis-trans isomerase [Gammaproteobacteria bacterium]|nr:FKBP-type peptidyl-prolyl cis-trans isomerase [Gammaproteobacteria bacterium]